MKKILLVILLIAIITGCQQASIQEVLSSDELQQKFIDANAKIKSYSFEMDMDMDMKTEVMGQTADISSKMVSEGSIDQENKKMSMKATITTESQGMSMDMDMEMYMVDDTMYTQTMGSWYKTAYSQEVWNQQDQLQNYVELIKTGTIEQLEDEKFDGKAFYVIKVEPDKDKFNELVMKQQAQSMPLGEDANLSDLVKRYSLTVWINKKDYVMEKSKVSMKMVVEADNPIAESTGGGFEMDSDMEMKILNINKPVTIDIPKEAFDAQEIDMAEGIPLDDEEDYSQVTTSEDIVEAEE